MKKNNYLVIVTLCCFLGLLWLTKAKTEVALAISPFDQSSSASCGNRNIRASFNYSVTTDYIFMVKRIHNGARVPLSNVDHLFKGDEVYVDILNTGTWGGSATSWNTPKPAIHPLGPCNPPPPPPK